MAAKVFLNILEIECRFRMFMSDSYHDFLFDRLNNSNMILKHADIIRLAIANGRQLYIVRDYHSITRKTVSKYTHFGQMINGLAVEPYEYHLDVFI